MKCNSKILLIITFAYIYIPIAIFLIGFTKLPICIITLLVCIYCVYKMYKDYASELSENEVKVSWPVLSVCIVLIIALCIALGFGGLFLQPGDWHKHNAVLHDLVERPWPVYYSRYENSMLTYYLGQYLVPATIGKMFSSYDIAEVVMAAWGMGGLVLVFLNLIRITVSDTIKKQLRLLWIMFFFCGALPLAQIVCLGLFGDRMYSMGSHHWLLVDGIMIQYRSNLIMIRWVFPQVIVIWLIVILFLENMKNIKHYVILMAPMILFGTFAVVIMGILAVIAAIVSVIVANDRKKAVRNVFSISNIVSFLTLGVVLIAYFAGYLGVEKPGYIGFGVLDFNLTTFGTVTVFTLFMVGIYAICIFEEQKKNIIYYCVVLLLWFIPYFKMGLCNDFVMGTSIPGLFILMIYVVDFLNKKDIRLKEPGRKHAYRYGVKYAVVIAILLIGSWYPFVELKENLYGYEIGDNSADAFGSMEAFSNRNSDQSVDLIYNYFTYEPDGTVFYEYIAKNKIK